jgi:hypothetical protein
VFIVRCGLGIGGGDYRYVLSDQINFVIKAKCF